MPGSEADVVTLPACRVDHVRLPGYRTEQPTKVLRQLAPRAHIDPQTLDIPAKRRSQMAVDLPNPLAYREFNPCIPAERLGREVREP